VARRDGAPHGGMTDELKAAKIVNNLLNLES
jgi:hypothetical protein